LKFWGRKKRHAEKKGTWKSARVSIIGRSTSPNDSVEKGGGVKGGGRNGRSRVAIRGLFKLKRRKKRGVRLREEQKYRRSKRGRRRIRGENERSREKEEGFRRSRDRTTLRHPKAPILRKGRREIISKKSYVY